MLQITILHEPNSVKVLEIKEVDTLTIISQFDEEKKKIDLEPLQNYVGQKALISHFNRVNDSTVFDYEHVKTITEVNKDANDIWYFQYN